MFRIVVRSVLELAYIFSFTMAIAVRNTIVRMLHVYVVNNQNIVIKCVEEINVPL